MRIKSEENPVTGTVRTNKFGSNCEFYICEREEWNKLSEGERDKLLMEAMWDAGVVEVYPNE